MKLYNIIISVLCIFYEICFVLELIAMMGSNSKKLARMTNRTDRKAFNDLFEKLWEPMYTYAASLLMDNTVAKDLVQEVWADYWQRKGEIEIQNVKSYLFSAIRYKCYNTLRDMKFNEIQIEAANSIWIASEIELEEDVIELSNKVHNTISDLPKRCQEIFHLSRINNFSNKEIAEKLKITQRSVENQLSFALRRLRKELSTVKSLFF